MKLPSNARKHTCTSKMNLIYMSVFCQESYINLLEMLIKSIKLRANLDNKTTHVHVLTSHEFKPLIENKISLYDIPVKYHLLDIKTIFDSAVARLEIFKYIDSDLYENLLYLDTDVLINSDINVLFNLDIQPTKLYALEEGVIHGIFWGSEFFDFNKHNMWSSAFSSGVLYFKNSEPIRTLFKNTLAHVEQYVFIDKNPHPVCLDQPFIIYNSFIENKYDNQLLKKYVENNPGTVDSVKIIYHFPGLIGNYGFKREKMEDFWNKMT